MCISTVPQTREFIWPPSWASSRKIELNRLYVNRVYLVTLL